MFLSQVSSNTYTTSQPNSCMAAKNCFQSIYRIMAFGSHLVEETACIQSDDCIYYNLISNISFLVALEGSIVLCFKQTVLCIWHYLILTIFSSFF